MADLYEQWIEKAEGRKAFFYTDSEGRVRFAGGPGGGGGSSGSGGAGGSSEAGGGISVEDVMSQAERLPGLYKSPISGSNYYVTRQGNNVTVRGGVPGQSARMSVEEFVDTFNKM